MARAVDLPVLDRRPAWPSWTRRRVNDRPPADRPSSIASVPRAPSAVSASRATSPPFAGWTVVSALPWNTMVRTAPAGRRPRTGPFCIAAKADPTSEAAPTGRPECTPTAENSSG